MRWANHAILEGEKWSKYSASHSRVAPENVGLQKEQKSNTFACHTCNEVRLCLLATKLFNKHPLAILNGTSNPIGLHNEHSLFQWISIHLHYDVKASKHLASLLTTDWQREWQALDYLYLILSFRVSNFLFANSQNTQPHFITGITCKCIALLLFL
jgi:hypothetical protein